VQHPDDFEQPWQAPDVQPLAQEQQVYGKAGHKIQQEPSPEVLARYRPPIHDQDLQTAEDLEMGRLPAVV